MKQIVLLSSVLTLVVTAARASVWDAQNKWSPQYESAFATWVKTTFNQNIFLTGPYGNLPTDCADAGYGARLIFAYENKLPFVIKDSTGGEALITNEMQRFDQIQDSHQRFLKFAHYIFAITGTYTMPFDTYPMEINREWLKPGAINLLYIPPSSIPSNLSSHVEVVKDILDTGVVTFISSTVPQAVRKLKVTTGFNMSPSNTMSGLRNWKSPENYQMRQENIPGYSAEQFSFGWSFGESVTDRLKFRTETPNEKRQRIANNFCAQITERVEVVTESEKKRAYLDRRERRCFNKAEYEDYSTPSRDKKLKLTVESLVRVTKPEGEITESDILAESSFLNKCGMLDYAPGKKMTATEAARRAYLGMLSSDPNQLIAARWGDEPAQSIWCPDKRNP